LGGALATALRKKKKIYRLFSIYLIGADGPANKVNY